MTSFSVDEATCFTLVEILCELGPIMNRYDFIEVRRVNLSNVSTD